MLVAIAVCRARRGGRWPSAPGSSGSSDLLSALGGGEAGSIAEAAVTEARPAHDPRSSSSAPPSAVSGMVSKAVTRNPLADPGILGVTVGASLAVVTGIAFFGLCAGGDHLGGHRRVRRSRSSSCTPWAPSDAGVRRP